MGQFSWFTCDTQKQIKCNCYKDVYVLVPKAFGGGNIKEYCYDGYGNFGGHDICELAAEWNRDYLQEGYLIQPQKEHYEEPVYYQNAVARYKKACQLLDDYRNGNPMHT